MSKGEDIYRSNIFATVLYEITKMPFSYGAHNIFAIEINFKSNFIEDYYLTIREILLILRIDLTTI